MVKEQPHTASVTTLPAVTDAVLLERIQQQEDIAFSLLVQRHLDRYYRLAYRLLQQPQAAEDMVQEAFLKLWQAPHKWQPGKAAFTTWFYRVVLNCCRDWQRKHPASSLPPAIEPAHEQQAKTLTSEQQVLRQEREAVVLTAIGQLPARQQEALVLCFYEEVPQKEAASIMGVSLKALESLLMRAKATLRNNPTLSTIS